MIQQVSSSILYIGETLKKDARNVSKRESHKKSERNIHSSDAGWWSNTNYLEEKVEITGKITSTEAPLAKMPHIFQKK